MSAGPLPHVSAMGIATAHSTVSTPVIARSFAPKRSCDATRRDAAATAAAASEPASKNVQFDVSTKLTTATADRHSTIHARQNASPSKTM